MALRKAIGAVKDRASIRLAKVSANTSAELEVLIVKATSHDESPTDGKYYRQIINLASNSRGYVNTCVGIISKRIRKTRDWVVALKALMLVHSLLIDGDPLFEEEILYASRKGVRALNMLEFKDEAHSNSWDHTVFVRFYAMYLDEKVESAVFERKVSEGERKFEEGNAGFGGRESRDDFEYRMPKRSQSYGGFNGYLVRVEQKKEVTPIMEMKPERLLGRLDQQIRILDRVLACRPTGMAMNHRLVQLALYDVVKESFGLYSEICEALGVLLERFTGMVYAYCLKGFDLYVGAAKVIDELIGFYGWCKDMGVVRSSECPEVQKVSESLIATLGEFLREMTNRRTKSPERSTEEQVPAKQEPESGKDEVKALPPPAPEPQQKPKPQPPQVVEDLVNLKDDVVSADEHGNSLALALFSGPPTTNANGAWVAFPSHGDPVATSAWQTPAAVSGQADWESALVQSASNLSKQKATLGGGFDRLLLNGMYDQSGAMRQHMSSAQLRSRSVNSMAFPGTAGKFGTPALALPAPNGTIQAVGKQDPFAASLAIPPPSYVQVVDMERKQNLLVHEKQQQWQQYGRNGMQNQVDFTKISGVSNYYGHNPHSMMMPYGMQQVSSMRQPGGYYYPSY